MSKNKLVAIHLACILSPIAVMMALSFWLPSISFFIAYVALGLVSIKMGYILEATILRRIYDKADNALGADMAHAGSEALDDPIVCINCGTDITNVPDADQVIHAMGNCRAPVA